ncbi:MAG: deoxyhypusine synthase family protein [Candidatus Caldarchaeum sp.]|uniref:Deoxyhypusine synthase n=1 Tax=Caldiarchaeum subterraneum TaxID=311458 RepID=A0A7C4I386_CALS0|nr:deoxyhypusine synthase family protein [Candidatus Caldarchaeales archaeon]MDJ0272191.1 deoxyhypusine synthase family protein [Candidatus Caldarchaeales archaeon]
MQHETQIEQLLHTPLQAIEVGEKTIAQLLDQMKLTGFQGRNLALAAETWAKAAQAKDTVIMLGYAGSLSTTGQWKIVKWLVEKRFVDVVVSTGANISEDLIAAMGYNYYIGTSYIDDDLLRRLRIYRFHDVFVKEEDYIKMEEMIADFMLTLDNMEPMSSAEFLHLFGKWLDQRNIHGIVQAAYRAGVPVFSPAIEDSGYGVAYIINRHRKPGYKLILDHFRDYEQLIRIRGRHRDSAAVFIGGGVPKDFIQLSAVAVDILEKGDPLTTRPHRYAVQITTDNPHWGGLSGATLEEGKSWGKETSEGVGVQCFCDATIALPLIAHYLREKVGERKNKPDLSWVFST